MVNASPGAKRRLKLLRLVGARPQFMQAAPLRRELTRRGHEERLVHTGQHYDDNMSRQFFRDLGLNDPDVNLNIGSAPHGAQTGRMMTAIEALLKAESFDAVVVDGDTNTTLAGALAAAKLHLPIVHVEAGMRSFDRHMPEEINRVLTDHISTLLCTPTATADVNLANEGITRGVVRTGDLLFDCFQQYRRQARTEIIGQLGLTPQQFILATIHREENTESPERLHGILAALAALPLAVIVPVHPRTRPKIESWLVSGNKQGRMRFIDPVGYLEMLALETGAECILTDSGGVQREAFYASVPVVVLRDVTEWVEINNTGWAELAGAGTDDILSSYHAMVERRAYISNCDASNSTVASSSSFTTSRPSAGSLFGEGRAAERIATAIEEALL